MINERIEDFDLNEEMRTSFLEYAYSVIYARALPDARDGLKPVQRRIVYQMSQMNLYPDRPYVKSARVVGDVMGKLHPHGDSAIYEAMVRLAQDFSMRIPLVDGHGNFGSLDNGPAASRYTEARMSQPAVVMSEGLDEDVVDFEPNYDNKLQQPVVLPSAIPNLLVNGGSGIAVGMATNMVPHNLREVISGAVYLMNNPECTVEDLMKYIPGPDLPSGGRIIGLDPIRDAYRTGRGIFQMRAKANIEKIGKKQVIVITELPYQVGPEKVIDRISDAVKKGKIQGIAKADDLTDRKSGLRIEIVVKNGFNPNAILERLYKLTPLQDSFGINNVALVEGAPKTLGLKELLEIWVKHRTDVIRRQSAFRLKSKEDRLHLVDGLLIAILDIDRVISIIRESDDTTAASNNLQKEFKLSEIQSNYILDLRLRRLTKFSRIELEDEKAKLEEEIKELRGILADPELLKLKVISIMHETASQFGDDRRTVLVEETGSEVSGVAGGAIGGSPTSGLSSNDLFSALNASASSSNGGAGSAKAAPKDEFAALQVQDTPCYILQSATGLVARVVRGHKEEQARPPQNPERAPHDSINFSIKTTTRGSFGVLTSHGRVFVLSALELPEIARGANLSIDEVDKNTQGLPKLDKIQVDGLSGGISLNQLVSGLNPHEIPISIVPIAACDVDGQVLEGQAADKALNEAKPLAIGTLFGTVKRVRPEIAPHERNGTLRSEWTEINLDEGDSIVGVAECGDDDEIVFIATDSSILHYQGKSVRPQGRNAGGMAGMKLSDGERVIFFGVIPAGSGEDTDVASLNDDSPQFSDTRPIVFTVAGDADSLPGTENGAGKRTLFELYPSKGRATGGVRSQKFLKGQNSLIYAWVGRGDARANTAIGTPADMPSLDPRRDASGTLLDAPVTCVG